MKNFFLIILSLLFNNAFSREPPFEIGFKKSEEHFFKRVNTIWKVKNASLTIEKSKIDHYFLNLTIETNEILAEEIFKEKVWETRKLIYDNIQNNGTFRGVNLINKNNSKSNQSFSTLINIPDTYPTIERCRKNRDNEKQKKCFRKSMKNKFFDIGNKIIYSDDVVVKRISDLKYINVFFTITSDKKVVIDKIVSKTNSNLNQSYPYVKLEIYKVLNSLEIKTPAMYDNKPVDFNYKLPFRFSN